MKRKYNVKCQYCGAKAVLRDGKYVHGDLAFPGEKLWVCSHYPKCDSYVTAYDGTNRPPGILANAALRRKRQQTHNILCKLWKERIMTKREAYQWLRFKFGLSEAQAHIDRFLEYSCDEVIRSCQEVLKNHKAT